MILFDWLTFTCNSTTFDILLDVLDFSKKSQRDIKWTVGGGKWSYNKSYSFNGITLLTHEKFSIDEEIGFLSSDWCVDISGSGCRMWEDISGGNWIKLLSRLQGDDFNITRLDIAYDDKVDGVIGEEKPKGLLNINTISKSIEKGMYLSKCRWWSIERSSKGVTCYIGSPQSDFRLRIYDKAAERDRQDEPLHWIRVEMQLRHGNAVSFSREYLKNFDNIGDVFKGVLLNYLRFINNDNSVKTRCSTTKWWCKFTGNIERIKLYTAPGSEYNLSKLERYLFTQCGNSLYTYLKIKGNDYDSIKLMIDSRSGKLNKQQQSLILEHENLQSTNCGVMKVFDNDEQRKLYISSRFRVIADELISVSNFVVDNDLYTTAISSIRKHLTDDDKEIILQALNKHV